MNLRRTHSQNERNISEKEENHMCRPTRLYQVAIIVGCLLLVGLLLPVEPVYHTALAQELPPRPTLTPAEDDDDDGGEPTPTATAIETPTLMPTAIPTAIPTEVPPTPLPTPAHLPVTGRDANGGVMWIVLAIGLVVCAVGLRRALWYLLVKGQSPPPSH